MKKVIAVIIVLLGVLSGTDATAQSDSADIVVMIDLSASTSSSGDINDLEIEKNATRALLNFFKAAPVRPRVAIGSFNVDTPADSGARILSGGELSTDYDKLASVLSSLTTTAGFTDLAAAISVAQAHLQANPSTSPRYIILISDGTPNRPGAEAYESCGNCGCPNAYNATNIAITQAEGAGTTVFAVHYVGHGFNVNCADEPQAGLAFMRESVASSPDLFYQGNADLSGVFNNISCAISCDDGDPCTRNSCGSNGQCTSEPLTDDRDGDGVLDCRDKCQGDDNTIGQSCTEGAGVCAKAGTIQCTHTGTLGCSGTVADFNACFSCTSVDVSAQLQKVSTLSANQLAIVKKLVRQLSKRNKNKSVKKFVRQLTVRINGAGSQQGMTLSSFPNNLASCGAASCVQVYETAKTDIFRKTAKMFKTEADRISTQLKKSRRFGRSEKKLQAKSRQLLKDISKTIDALPTSSSSCS